MDSQGEDFARVRILGIDYVCSCGKALAYGWNPIPEEEQQAEVQEIVVSSGRTYQVGVLIAGIFSKSLIRSVSIPNTVRLLPNKCFEFCEQLVTVTFAPESQICSFGAACFKRCGLCEIEVPDNCTSIGPKCFDGCTQLTHLEISDRSQLEKIGNLAFRGCSVVDLYLPDELVIDHTGCIFLGVRSVNVGNNNQNFIVDSDCLMSRDRKTLIHCSSGHTGGVRRPCCTRPTEIHLRNNSTSKRLCEQ